MAGLTVCSITPRAGGVLQNLIPDGPAGERPATLWSRYSFNEGSLDGWWVGAGFVHPGDKAQRTADPALFLQASTTCDMPIGRDWKMAGANWSGAPAWRNDQICGTPLLRDASARGHH